MNESELRHALTVKADGLVIEDRDFDPAATTSTPEPVSIREGRRTRWIVLAAALLVVVVGVAALVARAANSSDHTVNVITPPSTTPSSTPGIVASKLSIAPSARTFASMAFDPSSKSIVLFGGFGPYGTLGDTWTWDGSNWHQEHPATTASDRAQAGIAFEPASGKVLMLGGRAEVPLTDPCERPANAAPVCKPATMFRDVSPGNDLWAWDGANWRPRLPANVPPKPDAMVTQADGSLLVLSSNQTWTFDSTRWQQRGPGPATATEMSELLGVAVDPGTHRVIAIDYYQPGVCMPHSGCQQPAQMRTFAWTGSTWTKLHDRNMPDAAGNTLVPDPASGGLLMRATDHSTWLRSPDGNWRRVASVSASPTASTGMTLVADPVHRVVVGFGGVPDPININNFDPTNDTWIWNGTRWRVFSAPASPWPIPAPPAIVDCTLNGPSLLGSQKPARSTEARIVASNMFTTPPCRLRATFTLTLRTADGKMLAVAGNPSTVTVDTTEPAGKSAVNLEWSWLHPCASGPVHADVAATGAGAFPTPFPIDLAPVPACTGSEHSTLSALAPS